MVQETLSKLRVILNDVASSSSTHRKNLSALFKTHKQSDDFTSQFESLLMMVLGAPKGNSETDRVSKFLVDYVRLLNTTEESKPYSVSLVSTLLPTLLDGFEAANKAVRYRCCSLVAQLLNDLEEVDEDMFKWIQTKFTDRVRDKEPQVRVQAAFALCRLQNAGTDNENKLMAKHLIQLLSLDTSSDVRKTVLWNIQVNQATLPYIVARARDIDPQIRRLTFLRLKADHAEIGGLLPPQLREWLLTSGLKDREANVKRACLKMMCDAWIADFDNNLLEFVATLDVRSKGSCAELALVSFFQEHPEAAVDYNDVAWNELNAEAAFLVRVYSSYRAPKDEALVESLPSLSEMVNILEHYSSFLTAAEVDDETRSDVEYVLDQLLQLGSLFDLTDELGRERLVSFLNQLISGTDIPESAVELACSLLQKAIPGTKSFLKQIMIVLESVQPDPNDESALATQICQLKQLEIIKASLSMIHKTSSVTDEIYACLEGYVFPAMASLKNAIRKAAVTCLGICCLHDSTLMTANLDLFVAIAQDPKLKSISQRFFVDLVFLKGLESLDEEKQDHLLETLETQLGEEDEETLCLSVLSACKLLLLGRINSQRILKALINVYFHPDTTAIQRVHQYLSYFFPVYCGSSLDNCELLFGLFVPVLGDLVDLSEQYNEEKMMSPIQMASQLLSWADFLARSDETRGERLTEFHEDLLKDLVVSAPKSSSAARRVYCQVIGKLQVRMDVLRKTSLPQDLEKLKAAVIHDQIAVTALKKFLKALGEETTIQADE